ncbi:unnamed protein product, partial [marine sediment metagenome]
MVERYSIVAVRKKKKGTQVAVIGTYETKERAELIRGEKKWGGSRGIPHVMKESEVAEFARQRRTGIFAPTYTPPTQEEIRVKTERQKAQEKFEREREVAKEPTE